MTRVYDLTGNTLHADGVVVDTVEGVAGAMTVGSSVTSAGGNITIAASDTIAAALKEIADIADPDKT